MFCFHKYGKVEGNYQYCSKCGKAIRLECDHVFKIMEKYNIRERGITTPFQLIILSKCEKCGEIKKTELMD